MNVWRYYPDECNACGGDLEVFTDEKSGEGWVYDDDPIRCTECSAKGVASVHDFDCVYIQWDEDTFPDE